MQPTEQVEQFEMTSVPNVSLFDSFPTFVGFAFTFGMLIYWVASFFILYHLIRFGVSGQPKKIALVFLGGSIFLSIVATLLFAGVMIR